MKVYLTPTKYVKNLAKRDKRIEPFYSTGGSWFIPNVVSIHQHPRCAFWLKINISGELKYLIIKKSSLHGIVQ